MMPQRFDLSNDASPGNYLANQTLSTSGQPQSFGADFRRGEHRMDQLRACFEF